MAVYIPMRPRWNPRGVVVNYVAFGQLCVRSWPKGYRDANTPAQRRQRGKMAQVCSVLPYVKSLLAEGYSPHTKRNGRQVGGYHAAVSTALREWFVAAPGGAALDCARLRLTDGAQGLPAGLRVEREGGALRVAWREAVPWRGARLLLAARGAAGGQWVSLPIALPAGATRVTVRLPKAWRGKGVEVWAAFVGRGRGERTVTRYVKMDAPRTLVTTSSPPQRHMGEAITARLAHKGRSAGAVHRAGAGAGRGQGATGRGARGGVGTGVEALSARVGPAPPMDTGSTKESANGELLP